MSRRSFLAFLASYALFALLGFMAIFQRQIAAWLQ